MKNKKLIYGVVLIVTFTLVISYFNNQLLLEKAKYQDSQKQIEELNVEIKDKDNYIIQLQSTMDSEILNNPIDKFFEEYAAKGDTTLELNVQAVRYSELWEAEMNYCYDLLIRRAHTNIKEELRLSKLEYYDFIEKEFNIAMAVEASDGFGNETGQYGKEIGYGTIAPTCGSYATAELFKYRTIQLHNYLDHINIEYKYVFNKDSLLETGLFTKNEEK